nr:division/cell wall cluster transcriptional repressor MraZ [uncultured Anaeromusa sp.]
MLLGEYQHTLDAKGRLILPAKFREEIGETIVFTKGLDDCLFGYSLSEWSLLEEKLKKLPLAKPEARAFTRFFFAGAAEIGYDKQGRILLPPVLREHARLEKEVVVIGVSNRIEIWSQDAWNTYNEALAPSVSDLTQELIDLGI